MLVRDDAFQEIIKIILDIFIVFGNERHFYISRVSFFLVNK